MGLFVGGQTSSFDQCLYVFLCFLADHCRLPNDSKLETLKRSKIDFWQGTKMVGLGVNFLSAEQICMLCLSHLVLFCWYSLLLSFRQLFCFHFSNIVCMLFRY